MPVPRFKPNIGGGSRTNLQTSDLSDFTGGLNLNPDEFQLTPNESPELLNVDVSYRGGIAHRKGFVDHSIALGGAGDAGSGADTIDAHPWYGQSGAEVDGPIIFQVTGLEAVAPVAHQFELGIGQVHEYVESVAAWTGRRSFAEFEVQVKTGARAGTTLFAAGPDRTVYEVFNSNTFVPGITHHTGNTTTFNDDLDSPTNSWVPRAGCVAVWQGSMWVADTNETTGVHQTRVRWSHPNYPKDWHSDHWVDLGDDSSGRVTALVPDGDRLLVFRERAIHAIVGAPPDALQVYLLTDAIGCRSIEKIAATEQGVYFWSDQKGVYKITSNRIEWVFEPLFPAVESGRLRGDERGELSWGGDRLYVKVEYDGLNGDDRYDSWFVYDPAVGKRGAWVQHAFTTESGDPDSVFVGGSQLPDWLVSKVGPSFWFDPPGLEPRFVVFFETPPSGLTDPIFWRSNGDVSDSVSTPTSSTFDPVSGDIWVAASIAPEVWSHESRYQYILDCTHSTAKQPSLGDAGGYTLHLPYTAHGAIGGGWGIAAGFEFAGGSWSNNYPLGGGGPGGLVEDTQLPFEDGTRGAIGMHVDVDNGEGGWTQTFYVSHDDGDSWLLFGQIVHEGLTGIGAVKADPLIGLDVPEEGFGSNPGFEGQIFWTEIRDGDMNGTLISRVDFEAAAAGDPTVTDAAIVRTWTVNGTSSIDGTVYTAPAVALRAKTSAEDNNGWNYDQQLRTNKAVARTRWFDAGEEGVLKRWRRFDVVGYGLDSNQTLTLEGYVDWDSTRRTRVAQVDLNHERAGGRYGTAVFGTDLFGMPDLPIVVVDRTPPMGRARAVQLKFIDRCDPGTLPWSVDAIIAKFSLYPVRG